MTMVASGKRYSTAACISSAVSTARTSQRGGGASAVGAETRMTRAPRLFSCRGQGISHSATRAIPEKPDGVDRFAGSPCRYQNSFAEHILPLIHLLKYFVDDRLGLCESAVTRHPASQISAPRLDHAMSPLLKRRNVRTRSRMIPHVHIHSRSDHHVCLRSKVSRRKKVIRDPMRELRNRSRCCRRNHQDVCPLCLSDVLYHRSLRR